ncbi:pentapeptide repeat-containing protein [Gloeocapsopsis dulcis]|uniref:Low-complexity protein n=1 Tax=Gloeocapsopsis dulcis AAB1 = 1H9 TaxID=1433147 RepID=A0A6N8FZ38_9CHRO|nr:pentapeptide repeat-containing protein [Gloeocapsopsis dulcis]MUL37994.1 low-complexity protein [Gloeocapsopsis dulcis AAB1 = 1H9]WNN91528.1 pentapeptide repeat-containing protein [Gloeocapsopsis dulcis]
MSLEPDSPPPNSPTSDVESQPEVLPDRTQNTELAPKGSLSQQALAALASMQSSQHQATIDRLATAQQGNQIPDLRATGITLVAIAVIVFGLALGNELLAWFGVVLTLLLSLAMLLPWLQAAIRELFSAQERSLFVAIVGVVAALIGIVELTGLNRRLLFWGSQINWEAFGTLAEWVGALGQILIAVLAVFVAWRQYVISKDLTIQQNLLTVQQNLITQQQTIDSYFQGISDLVLDDEGLLEDWPQERALAEGRTAAILSSVDRDGKAKILRFLSSSKLLTPLKRDSRLGRAILNGDGGYAEDRVFGVRVIDLGVMLAGADLSGTDLRWTDLSEANLIRVNLSGCDLVRANFARTILAEAKFVSADLKGTLLFYGSVETASPRSRTEPPNYRTGEYTGAVIENADFTNVQRMSESTRYYCCAWGGEKTRATIPGGCSGIPNKLGR